MTTSLQARLLLAIGALAVAAAVAVAVVARQGARQEFFRFQDVQRGAQRSASPAVARRLAAELDGRCCGPDAMRQAALSLSPGTALIVTDPGAGSLVASAGKPLDAFENLTTRRAGGELAIDATRRTEGGVRQVGLRFVLAGVNFRLDGGRAAVLYVLPFPDEAGDRNAARFLGLLDRRLVGVTGVVGAMALLITWTIARGLVRPLKALSAATSDLARGDLATRVVPRGSREVVELGRAFNAMALELDRQQALRRSLVHDVAHELRTPLTALRCRLETVIDGLSPDPVAAMRDLREEVLHLGRLVDDLQELALAEARELRLDIDDVDLAPVVESAIRAAGLEGDSRLRSEVVPGTLVRGDEGRLRQVVLNLLTNADRYTPASGSIVVRAVPGDDPPGQAQPVPLIGVEVRNSGSRLTADDLSQVFDRFYRADPSRERGSGGTGLGLAIVKHLIEAQGGRVWARSDGGSVTVGFGVPRGRSTPGAPGA